jgi:type I restriction enzyme, S subunit
MTDLPAGWEWTTLGEVAETSLGKMLDRGTFTGSNAVPYLRNINVHWGRFDLEDILEIEIPLEQQSFFELRPGDLMVCEGGEIGRCAVWPGSKAYMAFQKALHRVRSHPGVDARFLRYLLEHYSHTDALVPYSTGSTIKHLPQQQLRRLPLPLPPLAEQRRIVAVLDDHLSRIDASESIFYTATKRIAQMREQYIATACTGGLASVAGLSAPPPAYVGVHDGEIPPLPSNWKWTRLAEIADVVGGVTKDAKRQADVELPEVPYLRVANVQRGRLDLDRVTFIRVPIDKVRQLRLQTGDVLLNEGGDRDKLGRGWIWEGQIPECIHQNHVFRARIRDNQLDPKLLAWHANTFGKGWCEHNGKQSVNLASISLSKIRLLPVPVPPQKDQAPLVELIEEHLAELDQLAKSLRWVLRQSEHLRRSLLAEAFAGRLVQQDPNDEPAWVLLERIKAERATQPKTGRSRRTAKDVNPGQESML